MKTLNDNALIKAFMQAKDTFHIIDINNEMGDIVLNTGYVSVADAKSDKENFDYRYGTETTIEKEVNTYKTWNELMPVLEKIQDKCRNREDSLEATKCIEYFKEATYIKYDYASIQVGIDKGKVYENILGFIKWYNSLSEPTKEITVQSDEEYVFITCPHCEHWEQHPIDEQRHHIQTFDLKDWLPEVNDKGISLMKCHVCKIDFKLIWDYDNVIPQDKDC